MKVNENQNPSTQPFESPHSAQESRALISVLLPNYEYLSGLAHKRQECALCARLIGQMKDALASEHSEPEREAEIVHV